VGGVTSIPCDAALARCISPHGWGRQRCVIDCRRGRQRICPRCCGIAVVVRRRPGRRARPVESAARPECTRCL